MVAFKRSLFSKPKNKKLARIIRIDSPAAFRKSIKTVSKGGVTTEEKRALVLAKNRAGAQLKRKNLSPGERRQFTTISKQRLPNITRRNK